MNPTLEQQTAEIPEELGIGKFVYHRDACHTLNDDNISHPCIVFSHEGNQVKIRSLDNQWIHTITDMTERGPWWPCSKEEAHAYTQAKLEQLAAHEAYLKGKLREQRKCMRTLRGGMYRAGLLQKKSKNKK